MTGTTGTREAAVLRALRERVSERRVVHCEGVAVLAAEMCLRFGELPERGRLAGLGHDIAREMDPAEMRRVAARDGRPFDDDEIQFPVLTHGRAGAVLLADLGVDDGGVLDAVRDHVTGRAGMGRLSCIVFCADCLEAGRGFLTEPSRLAVLDLCLRDMVRAVLDETVRHLERSGKAVVHASRDLDRWLRQERRDDG